MMFALQFTTDYANWIVVAMTTERFLAVWFPLRVGRMYTRRKALLVLAVLALLTASVSAVLFWAFEENVWCGMPYCSIRAEYAEFIRETFYYLHGSYSLILPCCFICLGNSLIIFNVIKAGKVQRQMTNSFSEAGSRKARDQKQITVMLVVVSVVFLALNMPNAVFYMVKKYWPKFQTYSYEHAKYFFTARFISVLSDANHAVNFYIYFLRWVIGGENDNFLLNIEPWCVYFD